MGPTTKQPLVAGLWGVRYQVKDVQRSISFYTETLGFNLDRKQLPAFGQVSIGISNSSSVVPGRPVPGLLLMAVSKSRGDGTG